MEPVQAEHDLDRAAIGPNHRISRQTPLEPSLNVLTLTLHPIVDTIAACVVKRLRQRLVLLEAAPMCLLIAGGCGCMQATIDI